MGPVILAQMLSRFLTEVAVDLLGVPKEFATLVCPKNQVDNRRLVVCGVQNELVLHLCAPRPRFDALKECFLCRSRQQVVMHRHWYRCYVGQRFHHEVSGLGFRDIDSTSAALYELLIKKSYMSHLLIGTTRP
jgi:hypothetical protein